MRLILQRCERELKGVDYAIERFERDAVDAGMELRRRA
jgi:hypothetical protein